MSKFFRRRKFCKFSAEGATSIDYKDLNNLRSMFLKMAKLFQVVLPAPKRNISACCKLQSNALVSWL